MDTSRLWYDSRVVGGVPRLFIGGDAGGKRVERASESEFSGSAVGPWQVTATSNERACPRDGEQHHAWACQHAHPYHHLLLRLTPSISILLPHFNTHFHYHLHIPFPFHSNSPTTMSMYGCTNPELNLLDWASHARYQDENGIRKRSQYGQQQSS